MDKERIGDSPLASYPSNFATSTPKAETKSDCILFSSSSEEQLDPETCENSIGSLLQPSTSDFNKHLEESMEYDIETDSKLEYEYQLLMQSESEEGRMEISDSDSDMHSSISECTRIGSSEDSGDGTASYLSSSVSKCTSSNEDSGDGTASYLSSYVSKCTSSNEDSGGGTASSLSSSEIEDSGYEVISDGSVHSNASTTNSNYLPTMSELSESSFDFTESFTMRKSKIRLDKLENFSFTETSEEPLSKCPRTTSSFPEITSKSSHIASYDKSANLSEEPFNTIVNATATEKNKKDSLDDVMNDMKEFSGTERDKDASKCREIKEEISKTLTAENTNLKNNIVQELENYNINFAVDSEACSYLPKQKLACQTSFDFENNEQKLSANPLSCVKKECSEVFDGKIESQSINVDRNLLKDDSFTSSDTLLKDDSCTNSDALLKDDSCKSSDAVYCTPCKDSTKENKKRTLPEHLSQLKEITKSPHAVSDNTNVNLVGLDLLNTFAKESGAEKYRYDYLDKGMKNVEEFVDTGTYKEVSKYSDIKEGIALKLRAKIQNLENNILQEQEKYDNNYAVNSEPYNYPPKQPTASETSFNLKNNVQIFAKNLLSCVKKEYNDVFGDKTESEPIYAGINFRKDDSCTSRDVSSCTPCTDSTKNSNQNLEKNIIEEPDNSDTICAVDSKAYSYLPKQQVACERSLNLENNEKILPENLLSCAKKECKEVFGNKAADLDNSSSSTEIVYSTRYKHSVEESNKDNLPEHISHLKEISEHGIVDVIQPKQQVACERSLNLENNEKILPENLSSWAKKECSEGFDNETADLDSSSSSTETVYSTRYKDSVEESNKDNLPEHISHRKEISEHGVVDVIPPGLEFEALLELFNVDNVLSRKILLSLSNSIFRDGATVDSMLNHVRNDVSRSVKELRNDIKTFFRAAIKAQIIQMKSRRYFLKIVAKTKQKTEIPSKENVNKRSYSLRSSRRTPY